MIIGAWGFARMLAGGWAIINQPTLRCRCRAQEWDTRALLPRQGS